MVAYAINFLDVPYVEHTLDLEGPEELVLNCDEMDCTTFVEYVLAEALCPMVNGDISESTFAQNVVNIRYRDGKINGYTSRLHYISDWINNGVRNGFLEDITARESKDTQQLSLNYMSTHPQPELYEHASARVQTAGQLARERGHDETHRGVAHWTDHPLSPQGQGALQRTFMDKER